MIPLSNDHTERDATARFIAITVGMERAPWFRRALWWLVWHVRLGPLAPWVFGLALGRWPRRVR